MPSVRERVAYWLVHDLTCGDQSTNRSASMLSEANYHPRGRRGAALAIGMTPWVLKEPGHPGDARCLANR